MRELGRKGGRASVKSRHGLTDEVADDELRGLARKRLREMLDSGHPQHVLSAAKSLFSYASSKAPADAAEGNSWQDLPHRGVTIAKVLEIAVFEAQGMVDDALADVVLRSAAKARELKAAGKLSPTFVDQLEDEAVERFTADIERLADRKQNDEQNDEPAVHAEDGLAELERAWHGDEAA
jgi:hypothetical protein